jgi:hypothetical protein
VDTRGPARERRILGIAPEAKILPVKPEFANDNGGVVVSGTAASPSPRESPSAQAAAPTTNHPVWQ